MTKREAFVVVMTMLGETYRVALTDAMLDGYWLVLEGLSETELKAAARAALARPSGFMPSPGELLALVRPQQSLVVEASLAWDAVRQANRKISWTCSQIDFGPHVNAVLRQMGGWDAICSADVDDLNLWKRKEFERLYVEFASKAIGDMGRALEGPSDGRGYPPTRVPIKGIPSQPIPKALAPVVPAGAGDVKALIDELAESKS